MTRVFLFRVQALAPNFQKRANSLSHFRCALRVREIMATFVRADHKGCVCMYGCKVPIYFVNICSSAIRCTNTQVKRSSVEKPIAYKKIQGGIQSDVTLRMASNFAWDSALLLLHYFGDKHRLLPFRAEKIHGAKVWVEHRSGCFVKSCDDKHFTSVRVQFCKEYYDKPIQFSIKVDESTASTALPIVILREGLSALNRLKLSQLGFLLYALSHIVDSMP